MTHRSLPSPTVTCRYVQMLKHEMDQIWAAAKRLVEVAQADGAKDAVPELIKGWVASAPGAEVQSVQ